MESAKLPTGPELIDQISQHPTLDEALDRDPHAKPLSDEELKVLLGNLRLERAGIEDRSEMRRQKRKEKANEEAE